MNRMNEYEELLQELSEPVPALEETLTRAKKKLHKKRLTAIPSSMVLVILLFIVLVNFSAPVAKACSNIPILKELAKAVTFNRSLQDAIEHDYVQTMNLSQTKDDITAVIDYLIVDQKQVNVFLHFKTDRYESLKVTEVDVFEKDKTTECVCSISYGGTDIPVSEIQKITLDFVEETVPSELHLTFQAEETDTAFDFLLEFDPSFTETGTIYPLNETILLDGQQITFTTVEVYPTHLRVNIEDDSNNTAWLTGFDFHIETGNGKIFDTVKNGISATGKPDSKTMTSFRTDSPYFHEADSLNLVIDRIQWLEKDKEKCHLNLITGEIENLPEEFTLHSIKNTGAKWEIEFRAPQFRKDHFNQFMSLEYYTPDGEKDYIHSWSSGTETVDKQDVLYQTLYLYNFDQDDVWLCPSYSKTWEPEVPVTIKIK